MTTVVAFWMLAGFQAIGAPFDELVLFEMRSGGSIYESAFALLGQSLYTRLEVCADAATLVNDDEADNGVLRDNAEYEGRAMPSGMETNQKKLPDRLAGMCGGVFRQCLCPRGGADQ